MKTKSSSKQRATLPPDVRIVRSAHRHKTVGARWVGDTIEIVAPKNLSDADLAPLIERLRARLKRRKERLAPPSDRELEERAEALNRRYFDGKLKWRSIRFVANQQARFGSCTHETATIRLSDRLKRFPKWVLDYVLVHELAHLIHPNHSPSFWELVNRYPLTERARGFLMGSRFAEDDENAEEDP